MFFYPIKQMLFYLTESSNELKIIVPKKDFTFLSNWKTRRKCHIKVQDNSQKGGQQPIQLHVDILELWDKSGYSATGEEKNTQVRAFVCPSRK